MVSVEWKTSRLGSSPLRCSFLRRFVVAVGGDGVEVEIEIVNARQALGLDGDKPQGDQLGVGGGVEATEVLSEGAALGDGVEPGCVFRLT